MRKILIGMGGPMAWAGPALADANGGMMNGYGMGGYGFGGFGMLLFWGLVIAAVVLVVMQLRGRGESETVAPDALEELRLRYARGEIDEEEFQRRKAALDK